MGQAKGVKRSGNAVASTGMQQQISTMFGEKVKKPRMYMGSAAPTKTAEEHRTSPVPSKFINDNPVPPTDSVASQKRRWRLAELVKKEREQRLRNSNITPSFVFESPHMDTRRPQKTNNSEAELGVTHNLEGPRIKKIKLSPDSVKQFGSDRYCAPTQSNSPPGGEALLYDRAMLPASHALLLDVLQGLESAVSLLRTRRTLPTVAAVREIVSKSTKRTFTLRILSQLAHIVPEAVAVLPGLTPRAKCKRPSDNLIVRLDDIDSKSEKVPDAHEEKRLSSLGDSSARMRRALLHNRLLSHAREHHNRFLKESNINRYNGNRWHPDFDLERNIPELLAPPLYPMRLLPAPDKKSIKTSKNQSEAVLKSGDADWRGKDPSENKVAEDNLDAGIPLTLLQRVKARQRERSQVVAATEAERKTNRSLLTKLPCTMDAILSIMRGEKRSAIGWLQLLSRLEDLHPRKWSREDLEYQISAITDLASGWCRKVELKSSRGGYAFRVVAPGRFAAARAKVTATECYPATEGDQRG